MSKPFTDEISMEMINAISALAGALEDCAPIPGINRNGEERKRQALAIGYRVLIEAKAFL